MNTRIKLNIIIEKDNGQTDAIIKGFKMATGEILCWLNSDDVFEFGTLNQVAKYFTSNKVDVLAGRFNKIDNLGKVIWTSSKKELKKIDWFKYPMKIGQPSTFFTHDIYKKVGGLNPKFNYCMDYDLFIRFAKSDAKFLYVSDVFSNFRMHNESKTMSVPWAFWKEEFDIFRNNGGKLFSPFLYWKSREIISKSLKKLYEKFFKK